MGDQPVKPTPVLPPGTFTSAPPHSLPGQPGFGSLEGEEEEDDGLHSSTLPNDEFLVSFFEQIFFRKTRLFCKS